MDPMSRPDGEMRNPFRNESDAFRVLVMILIGFGIVVAAAEIVGSWLGVTIALIGIAVGIYSAAGWLREGLGESEEAPPEPQDDVRRPGPDGSGDGAPLT
jgi:hypothetical protein